MLFNEQSTDISYLFVSQDDASEEDLEAGVPGHPDVLGHERHLVLALELLGQREEREDRREEVHRGEDRLRPRPVRVGTNGELQGWLDDFARFLLVYKQAHYNPCHICSKRGNQVV